MSPWLAARVRLDRVLAALLLVPAVPVILLLGLFVRRDGGPAFVRVPRAGRHGRPFDLLKLRTMRAGGPAGLAPGPSLVSGESDPRITPMGRRLRRWRIDEIANLVNVVRGEMALLGPRPEAIDLVDEDDPRWGVVLAAPPAIAGPTQVLVAAWEAERMATGSAAVYRDEILPIKLAIDAWYVRTATPAVDLAVVRALLGWSARRPASALRALVAADVPEVAALP